MKNTLAAVILSVPLLLAGCSTDNTTAEGEGTEAEATESMNQYTAEEQELIDRAGGEGPILSVASLARDFCHRETMFEGTPIAESGYSPNEFQGAYIEEGGRHIRHIIAGTVTVPTHSTSGTSVGYSCAYLQRQTDRSAAAEDDLGIVVEDEAIEYGSGGESLAELRETLRDFHDLPPTSDEAIVYPGDYAEASNGWIDTSEQGSNSSSVASPETTSETYDDPLTFMLDGTYLVGQDVVPGTYRAEDAGTSCYWARLSGLSGESSDIIANEARAVSPVVTLSETDTAFQSRNCGLWMQVN